MGVLDAPDERLAVAVAEVGVVGLVDLTADVGEGVFDGCFSHCIDGLKGLVNRFVFVDDAKVVCGGWGVEGLGGEEEL